MPYTTSSGYLYSVDLIVSCTDTSALSAISEVICILDQTIYTKFTTDVQIRSTYSYAHHNQYYMQHDSAHA